MIEILSPSQLDHYINDGLLDAIREFSLLDEQRIGWNYCFDYTWICQEFDKVISSANKPVSEIKVIDIGAGPGAIHGYLEDKYSIEITGIDLHRWDSDYVDCVGDFNDETFRDKFELNNIDIIISASAFEHNKPSLHARLVKNCLENLNDDGFLITTFSISGTRKIQRFKQSYQWNLPSHIIQEMYGEPVLNQDQYQQIWEAWHSNEIIRTEYEKRFGYFNDETPPFLSVGANIGKDNLLMIKKRLFYLFV